MYVKNVCKKDYIWNPATCNCENGKYLASTIDDSVIVCVEVIDVDVEAKSNNETNFNERKAVSKTQHFYILLAFLLITIALLIVFTVI